MRKGHVWTLLLILETEISTHGCLASVTVGRPSVWLVGVVTRISLFVVAEGWQFINSPIKSGP